MILTHDQFHPLRRALGKPYLRRELPPELPRETVVEDPDERSCPDCRSALRELGEDVSEILEYEPARSKVIRRVRPKLSCGCCDRLVQAPAVRRPALDASRIHGGDTPVPVLSPGRGKTKTGRL